MSKRKKTKEHYAAEDNAYVATLFIGGSLDGKQIMVQNVNNQVDVQEPKSEEDPDKDRPVETYVKVQFYGKVCVFVVAGITQPQLTDIMLERALRPDPDYGENGSVEKAPGFMQSMKELIGKKGESPDKNPDDEL